MSELENKKYHADNRINIQYREARLKMVNAIDDTDYDTAIEMLQQLDGYRDSEELIELCKKRKEKYIIKQKNENSEWNEKYSEMRSKKIKDIVFYGVLAAVWIFILIIIFVGGGPSTPTA